MDLTTPTTYHFPTSIRFGAGVINELSDYLSSNKLSRPLLVTDPVLEHLPVFKNVLENLNKNNINASVFSEIEKNPIKRNVLSGVDCFHSNSCDSIIGFGGGASMDVARSIALKANHPDNDLFDFDDALGGDRHVVNPIPHFVTVPTTSGTGSEVGRSAVISDDITHQKRILFSPELMAKKVFVDPELSLELPAFTTAATGMDALTHNIEAYLAKGFSPLCDGIALEGIRLVAKSLKGAVHSPNVENRAEMAMAALMGATAFQKGLGVVHSLAHPLSTVFNLHHGLANAIMLPFGVQFNAEVVPMRIMTISKELGLDGRDPKELFDYIRNLSSDIGLPLDLGSQGVTKEKVSELVQLSLKDPCHLCNPREVTESDFTNLYLKAL